MVISPSDAVSVIVHTPSYTGAVPCICKEVWFREHDKAGVTWKDRDKGMSSGSRKMSEISNEYFKPILILTSCIDFTT